MAQQDALPTTPSTAFLNEAAVSAGRGPPTACKKTDIPVLSALSLCLSRACLGKMNIFSIKWRKRFAFSHLRACLAGAAPVHTRAIKLFQLLTDGQLAVPVAVDVARQAKEAAARIREILAPAQHVIVPHVRGRGGVGVVAAAPEPVE